MLSKLREDFEKAGQAKEEKEREKKQPKLFIARTEKQIQQNSDEEQLIRDVFTMISEGEYDEDHPVIKKAIQSFNIEEKVTWDSANNKDKRNKVFDVLKKDIRAPYMRPSFIENITNLGNKLVRTFIDEYLESNMSYTDFYAKWIDLNKQEVKDYINKRDAKNIVEKVKVSSEALELKKKILDNAKMYAEELNANILITDDQDKYSEVLRLIIESQDPPVTANKIKNLHKIVSVEYIELAKSLGVQNAKKLSIASLCEAIVRRRKDLASKLDSNLIQKINNMSREDLINEAKKYIENPDKKPSTVLIVEIMKNNLTTNRSKSLSSLVEEAKKLGIKNADEMDKSDLIANISKVREEKNKKGIKRALYNTNIVLNEKELKAKYKKLHPEADPKDIDAMVNAKIFSERIMDLEKEHIVNKLSKITGNPKQLFRNMPYEKLLEMVSDKSELWDSLKREAIIDSLIKLGVESENYDTKTTDTLENELLLAESNIAMEVKSREIINEYIRVKKCVDNMKDFSWYPHKITGVWLASPDNLYDISEYVGTEKIGPVNITVNGTEKSMVMYKANFKFFTLLCNRYSRSCKQVGNILTCYDIDKTPQYFVVAYSLKNRPDDIPSTKVKVKYPSVSKLVPGERKMVIEKEHTDIEYLVPQDEIMFAMMRGQKEDLEEQRQRSVDKILGSTIDIDSEGVVENALSSALLQIAPNVKEYRVDGDFVKRIVAIVKKNPNQVNRTLFHKIANVIAYFSILQAKTLREKIGLKYYIPDIFVELSPSEKLPEIYDNDSVSIESKAQMTSYIESSITRIVRNLAERLLSIKDPTFRKITRPVQDEAGYIEPGAIYTCENKEDQYTIPKENLIIYKEEDKSYCLDGVKIMNERTIIDPSGKTSVVEAFTNPVTGKRLNQEFIDVNYVGYFDIVDGRIYMFTFKELFDKFKNGDFINHLSTERRKFSSRLIGDILSHIIENKTYEQVLLERKKQHKKMISTVAETVNPQDVKGLHMDLIEIYTTKNAKYAFNIVEFFRNILFGVNPITNQAFSPDIIDKFMEKHKSDDMDIRGERIEEIIQETRAPVNLIVSDLWDIVTRDIDRIQRKALKKEIEEEETTTEEEDDTTTDDYETEEEDETEDAGILSPQEEKSYDEEEKKKEEEYLKKKAEEQPVIIKVTSPAEPSPAEPSPSEPSPSEKSSAEEQSSKSDSLGVDESETSKKEDVIKFGMKKETCKHCGEPLGKCPVKSTGYDGKKSYEYSFCCTDCMKAFNFPPIKCK